MLLSGSFHKKWKVHKNGEGHRTQWDLNKKPPELSFYGSINLTRKIELFSPSAL